MLINPFDNLIIPLTENTETWHRYYYNNKPTKYLISDKGKVYSENSNKLIKQYVVPSTGYHRVEIRVNNKPVRKYVHVMVMESFRPVKFTDQTQVNHKNGLKSDNRLTNLEWCTPSFNNKHAISLGLRKIHYGEESSNYKYSDEVIHTVCRLLESGLSVNETSKIVNIGPKYIREIRQGKSRANIQKQYKLERLERRHIDRESKSILNKMIPIICENEHVRPKELCQLLGIEYNNKNRCKVKNYKKMIINRYKVQRLGKARQPH